MHLVKLNSSHRVAIIDDEDRHLLIGLKWHLRNEGTEKNPNFYAGSSINATGRRGGLLLHRLVMGAKKGQQVDHINHNGLDCRKENLRFCTTSQNHANKRPYNKVSKYKGVSFRYGRFQARVCFERKNYQLGKFDSEELAAQAYDKKAKELFGEFACLNFPESLNENG